MAVGAGFTQTILVGILFPVAGETLHRRLPILQIGYVTTFALDAGVGAAEREVGGLVIEVFFVQPDYVFVPALMIGVAMLAFTALYIAAFAVETGFGIDILCDLLMARQT